MPMDSWYDLTIREPSDLADPAKEMLAEAAEALPEPVPGDDEDEAPESPSLPAPRPH